MRYILFSTLDTVTYDDGENKTVISANTVLNVVEWDGVTPYNPGDEFRLKQSDTLQIGDSVV